MNRLISAKTYVNTLTSTEPNSSRLPMVVENDRAVFQACVKLCGKIKKEEIRMVIIPDTKHLEEIYMSGAAIDLCLPSDSCGKRIYGGPF